ncbi:MAG TPA: hydroxylamine reductase [Anaerolineae bacterium]|nr:hydroxylamine reductase [Anaerolineae bacterium]HQI86832.1 hydroxylamine reductase [Anaerolineae bacterium]
MFCYQCEQTAKGEACTVSGVCGKDPVVAALQDLLIENLTGIAFYAHKLHGLGVPTPEANAALIEGLFTTVTNVNFDAERLRDIILDSQAVKEQTRAAYVAATGADAESLPAGAALVPADTVEGMLKQAAKFVLTLAQRNDDVTSLRSLILFGLKGMAAYADHARIMGKEDTTVNAFFSEALSAIRDNTLTANDLIALTLKTGEVNLRCMELLDSGHVKHFGHPVPTAVPTGVRKGPAIVVSGHDLPDLEMLLQQTEGKGITIYTHGEMLPAHGYPGLKKYAHLYGNYGSAWQNQQKEFAAFPGAILMTTNCIQKPRDGYMDNIFTTGLVAWPGVEHIEADAHGYKDFTPVIERALALGGFPEDKDDVVITVGFGRNAVLGVADKVIDAVKAGQIKHFFLIGGCDGAKPGRNYYTEFAEQTPADTVMLTLACGKYRFNKGDYGDIGGIPRLLDVGQCNDAYSAIQIAVALSNAFGVGVNDLPLSFILSWYEQKAVVVLLTLLYLGIKNIKLGPSLPAFVSPGVLKVLVENFAIAPISTVEADMAECLA